MTITPEKVDEEGRMIFNTDLVKMKVNIKNAEQIFKRAIEVLKGEIPEAKDCEYCSYCNVYSTQP